MERISRGLPQTGNAYRMTFAEAHLVGYPVALEILVDGVAVMALLSLRLPSRADGGRTLASVQE